MAFWGKLKDISERIKKLGGESADAADSTKPTADRTAGLSRGSQSPRPQKKPKEEPVKTLKDSIGDRQANSPFF